MQDQPPEGSPPENNPPEGSPPQSPLPAPAACDGTMDLVRVLDPRLDEAIGHVARESIRQGLLRGVPLRIEPERYPDPLRQHCASFVTLHRNGQLRGCIGVLDPQRPLVEDVAQNAFAAAFRDPRFEPLDPLECHDLTISISLLSDHEPLNCSSEAEFLMKLRPGVDGVVLEWSGGRGTFLPAVWQTLPDTGEFIRQLKVKAGLAPEQWPSDLQAKRYTTRMIGPLPYESQ